MELEILELNAPQADILQAAALRYLLQMGQGGGKTAAIGYVSYLFASKIPETLGLIAANTYGQLSDSTLVEVFKIWKKNFGWTKWTKENPSGFYVINNVPPPSFKPHGFTFTTNYNKIFLRNGAVIMTASLDNYTAIEGRSIGWALLDETADTKVEAIKEVITGRLRDPNIFALQNYDMLTDVFPFCNKDNPRAGEVTNPLFIFTKPVKEQWLTEFFNLEKYREEIIQDCRSETNYFSKHDASENRVVVIASTYHNAHNLPPDYISQRKMELSEDMIDLVIYGSPFGKSGQEYYKSFKHSYNVWPVNYIEGLPLHITFDFNTNPYMTGKVWIYYDDGEGNRYWMLLREYAARHPNNSIEGVSRMIIEDWKDVLKKYGMFYYGDATGKNSIPVESVKNYYNVIESMFRIYIDDHSRCILKQNKRHRSVGAGTLGRRDLMNKCLKGGFGFRILIDPSCVESIKDYEFVLENKNGVKLKVKKEINGVVCEERGHMSDADDAIFCYHYDE